MRSSISRRQSTIGLVGKVTFWRLDFCWLDLLTFCKLDFLQIRFGDILQIRFGWKLFLRKIIRTLMQSRSVVSPDSVRNGECSPSPSGAVSRDLGGSSRELGGSSREVGASSSQEGSDLKSFSSSSDARSRERWRSMARRGSFAEGNHQDILGQESWFNISWGRISGSGSGYPGTGARISFNDNILSGQNGSGAKRKSERKGSSSAGEIHWHSKIWNLADARFILSRRMKASRREVHILCAI